MKKYALPIGLFIVSGLCVLAGALLKLENWGNFPFLMLAGIPLRLAAIIIAIVIYWRSRKREMTPQ